MNRIPTLALVLLIVAGPAIAQLFSVDNPIFRPWKMYGTVAVGAAFGDFKINRKDTAPGVITVPEALGLKRYREQQPYPGSGDITRDLSDTSALVKVAKPICSSLNQDESLSFIGRVATRYGWVTVVLNHQALCERGN